MKNNWYRQLHFIPDEAQCFAKNIPHGLWISPARILASTSFALFIGPIHGGLEYNSLPAVEALSLKDSLQSVEVDVSERLRAEGPLRLRIGIPLYLSISPLLITSKQCNSMGQNCLLHLSQTNSGLIS